LLGLALAGFALLWLGLVAMVVMPRFHEPSTLPTSGENRTVEHFAALRTHPIETLSDLATQRFPRAARWMLAPTGGLPLLAPQVLIAAAPQEAALLLADKGERFRRHWTAPLLPTIWLATVVGFAALPGRPLRLLALGLIVAGTLATFLLDSNLPGGGDYDPADTAWSDRAEQDTYLEGRVPPGASLAASRRFLGAVADRTELYVFPPSYLGKLWPPERRPQTYLLDLTNDGTREALAGRQSPLRANRPYAIWLAGSDAMLLLERAPEPSVVVDRDVSGIRLHGYTARQSGDTLEIELHWQAIARPDTSLVRTVSGFDAPFALTDFLPTDQWPAGQVVIDRVRLPATGSGPIVLRVGWEPPDGPAETIDVPMHGP
jgi:hypothetical protein